MHFVNQLRLERLLQPDEETLGDGLDLRRRRQWHYPGPGFTPAEPEIWCVCAFGLTRAMMRFESSLVQG